MSSAEEVLSRINHIRAAYRLVPLGRLQAGLRGTVSNCPIARSLRYRSGILVSITFESILVTSKPYAECMARQFGGEVVARDEFFELDTPELFQDFIADFDAGKYPELVAS